MTVVERVFPRAEVGHAVTVGVERRVERVLGLPPRVDPHTAERGRADERDARRYLRGRAQSVALRRSRARARANRRGIGGAGPSGRSKYLFVFRFLKKFSN